MAVNITHINTGERALEREIRLFAMDGSVADSSRSSLRRVGWQLLGRLRGVGVELAKPFRPSEVRLSLFLLLVLEAIIERKLLLVALAPKFAVPECNTNHRRLNHHHHRRHRHHHRHHHDDHHHHNHHHRADYTGERVYG